MIYLLSNNIHTHMKICKFRIRFETYKNLKLKFAKNVIEMFLLQFQKQMWILTVLIFSNISK